MVILPILLADAQWAEGASYTFTNCYACGYGTFQDAGTDPLIRSVANPCEGRSSSTWVVITGCTKGCILISKEGN